MRCFKLTYVKLLNAFGYIFSGTCFVLVEKTSLVFMLLLFNLNAVQSNEVDLFLGQILVNESIINSRQIKIPEYPNAYNPSIIPYKSGFLLSFRYVSRCPEKFKGNFRTDVSFIGIVKLDKNFKVVEKSVQLLNVLSSSSKFSLSAEDARLFNISDRIFIVFNDLPVSEAPNEFAMYFGEIIEEQGSFILKAPAKPFQYFDARSVEKNWSPFVSENKLYVIYSDQLRIILEVDVNTGSCREVARQHGNYNWSLGTIRGGTPACLVNDVFLTVFHSSFPVNTSKGKAYVMGAYTFDKDPPFSIQSMTFSPIGDLKDYIYDNPSKIVFPGGLVVQDSLIHVAWGKADKQIFITTFDREKFLASLQTQWKSSCTR